MELFKLFGTIALDNSEANKGIDETTDKAEKSQSKISSAFQKVGGAAAKVGKAVATGLAAGTAAIGALAKQSLDSYADYEQLVGGVETLFKDSAMIVQGYADAAYKTAGLSANEYMETVTSFSASLLQGLGGDTEKAAKIADRAIVDMADNANKMGTNISMIQNAYQGFAKQNYTMLDNLKLGYGGTQAEMARLINDSGVLGDAMTVTAKNVNEVSFDKIIEAIGVIQDRMGITGTTAKEASSTISGSLSSMKSQWKNLLTAVAGDGWDIGVYVSNFVDTVITAMNNIVPRIAYILSGISDALPPILSAISAELPAMLNALLPGLLSGAATLLTGLVNALPQLIQIITAELPTLIPILISSAIQIVAALVNALPQILAALAKALPEAVRVIWDAVKNIFSGVGAWFSTNVIQPVANFFSGLWDRVKSAATSAWDFIKGIWASVTGWFKDKIVTPISNIFGGLFEGIKSMFKTPINWIIGGINTFIRGINKIKIPDWVPVVGGLGFRINELPKLEKGGILERGQVGLLEGNGAEAVVPLDQNRAWISAVARDMKTAGIGGQSDGVVAQYMQQLIDMLADYFPQLVAAAGHDIVTNDGVIVAHYGPLMNAELGRISARKDRGR